MKRILVTGATGFVGRHVMPFLLADEWDVHAVSYRRQLNEMSNITWHTCNLLDRVEARELFATVGATHLLHLAWYAEPGKFWTSPENFRWVRATLELLEFFHAFGGKRIVAAGTCAEYDWNFGYCREAVTPLTPATPYGKCKDALRSLLEAYGDANGLQIAWGRIFYLYGPHEAQGRLFSSIAVSLLRGEEARCTHGNQVRDFLHVEDVAAAFACLAASETTGSFNIGSSQPVKIREVAEILAREMGRPELLRLGVMQPQPDDPPFIVADNRRLLALGWKQRYSLLQGIVQTAQWWIHRKDLSSKGTSES